MLQAGNLAGMVRRFGRNARDCIDLDLDAKTQHRLYRGARRQDASEELLVNGIESAKLFDVDEVYSAAHDIVVGAATGLQHASHVAQRQPNLFFDGSCNRLPCSHVDWTLATDVKPAINDETIGVCPGIGLLVRVLDLNLRHSLSPQCLRYCYDIARRPTPPDATPVPVHPAGQRPVTWMMLLDGRRAPTKNRVSMQTMRMATKSGTAKKNISRPGAPIRLGIIGLGLMGQGIATCLLAHGHEVVGFDADPKKNRDATRHVKRSLQELAKQNLLKLSLIKSWPSRLHFADSLSDLAGCAVVIECVREDLELKRSIFAELELLVPRRTIIASNTSSLPITLLQSGRIEPARYIGMHWGEPAQIMRYLEIIPGKQTGRATINAALRLGLSCGKEPAILKQDIRGFLSNRMMYAMLREACYLVEAGIADIETVDQSFRNDIGWWALFAGPFRWMDLTGIPSYAAVMEGLLPELTNSTTVPEMMRKMVKKKALGIANQKGFYPYTEASAKKWEKNWVRFTYEMRKLAERYTPTS